MTSRTSRLGAVLGALLLLALLPLAGAPPARAQRLGPGQVAMPGFSGYVTRGGGELGIGRLGSGIVGICLDTGPALSWPRGTPLSRAVLAPRAAYLAATYLARARRDGRIAAALWWTVGGTLGLNSHPTRVRQHVAGLHSEAPRVYAAVRAWHDRMLAAARRNAPGAHGYTTALRVSRVNARTARVGGLGVRSASGRWVAGRPIRLSVTGGRFADGRTTWSGTSGATARTLVVRPAAGHTVRLHETIAGLPSPYLRVYDAGGSTQRVATAARRVSVGASTYLRSAGPAVAPVPRMPSVRLKVVKTSEGHDPAGLIGVGVAIHTDSATGPVIARHTFAAAEVASGSATYATTVADDPSRRYVVTVTAEPAGWLPEANAVPAVRSGGELVARLVDDRIWHPTLATQISARLVRPGATLHDRVDVRDTGGDTLTGHWRLLGPLAPRTTGCSGLAWSGAPDAASGDVAITGDGSYSVGERQVGRVGCYTYVESLTGNRTTTSVPWTTPGQVPETTLVRSAPRLATTVSSRRATAGAMVSDRVRVTGIGTGATPIRGEWELLGPVAPNHHLRCTGLSWSGARVAAHGTLSVRRNGRVTIGRHRIREGGCYTYRERLAATMSSLGVAWTRPGVVAETIVVAPRRPAVPAHPTVPAGGGRPASTRSGERGVVQVAATRMRADLRPVAFAGRALVPPGDIRTGGLWTGGADLDAVVGTTVLVGHVSDVHDRAGAFHRLWSARVGQTITTTAPDGVRTRWRITRVRLTSKREVPRSLFGQGLARKLVLVTCGNEIHYPDGGFHYRSNLIVTAVARRGESRSVGS